MFLHLGDECGKRHVFRVIAEIILRPVGDDDVHSGVQHFDDGMGTDEAGSAGNEYGHEIPPMKWQEV